MAFVATPSFAATPAPAITSVSPNVGITGGGSTVTISGSNFSGATGVVFGIAPATGVSVVSSTQITATVPSHTAGIVDVRVVAPLGTSPITPGDHYSYQSTPIVTAVSPPQGAQAGGNTVTVTGSGFVGVSGVNFGAVAGTTVAVVSSTQLTVVVPSVSASATVDVTVTGTYGTSPTASGDHYLYEPTPVLTSLNHAVGVAAGGSVIVTGSNFIGTQKVQFGGASAVSATVNSATQLTVIAPAQAASATPVDVTVIGQYGNSNTLSGYYTYEVAPTVSAISPNTGSAAGSGSSNVQISGTGLADATGVLFGTTPATIVGASPDGTQLAVTAPAHAAGVVDVRVQLGNGTSAVATGDKYTYLPLPVITKVSPAIGALAGGGTVTITGTNFTGVTTSTGTVTFGGTAATVLTATATKLTVTAPAHAAGIVDIQVTGTEGGSIAVAADHYTYQAAPTVTTVSPRAGLSGGGTTVTVTGTGFIGVTSVTFGGIAGSSVSVKSATQLTVKTPNVGTFSNHVDVLVTGTYGRSAASAADHYTFGVLPTVSSLSSNIGVPAGGSSVQITGTNFPTADSGAGVSVLFGSTPGTNVVVVSATQISVTIPAHAAGLVDVHVVLGTSASATSVGDRYTFQPPPAVTKITPTTGSVAGGTTVSVTGTGFVAGAGAVTVTVGGIAATNVHVGASTTTLLTFTTPANSATAFQDVRITTPFGTSAIVSADRFTYEPVPVLTGLSVTKGVLGGANVITVTGTGFLSVSKVYFGATAAAKVVTVSSTQLTVTVPAHIAGTVDVTVVDPYGTTATGVADQYTYEPVPTVTSISAGAGSTAGGTTLTINGTGFLSITKVTFGSTLGTSVVVASPTQLTVTIPAHAAGTVDVQVIGAYGTSPVAATDKYIYQGTASIAGVVTGAGTPTVALAGVEVDAYDSAGNFVTSVTTGSTGAYTITGLGTGNYELDFTPGDVSYAPQWYFGQTSQSAASSISVVAGVALTGKNITLTRSASISGTVTGNAAAPLGDVSVSAYDAAGNFSGGANTTASGTYSITGLAAGSYSVYFAPQFGSADAATYAPQWYLGQSSQGNATPIVVTAGQFSTGDDATLVAGGSITGQVTNASSTAIASVEVSAFTPSGAFVGSALSDSSGNYAIHGLATGSYTLNFTPSTTYAPQWYAGQQFEDQATAVAVTAGATTSGKNVLLTASGTITGVVTGTSSALLPNVDVIAYDAEGNYAGGALTATDGSYEIDGLAAGSYALEFIPPTSSYATQWFNGAVSEAEAASVAVVAGGTLNENQSLLATGSISGTVLGTTTSTVTLSNVSVTAYDAAGNAVETVATDTYGQYTLTGLAAGSYTVEFVPGNSPFGPKWWNGAASIATATVIPVAAGQSVNAVNATLIGASISGTVLGTASAPLAGVRVYAVDAVGNGIGQTTTSSVGTYSIRGILAGSYTLEFVAPTGYANQWWSGKPTQTSASYISVSSGVAVSAENVTLAARAGSISGQVYDSGNLGLTAATLELYDAAGNWVEETAPNNVGVYTFTGVPAGSYAIYADASAYDGKYAGEWFGQKTTQATATLTALTTGAVVTGKDIELFQNDSIEGTVTNADGTPGVGVEVNAFNSAGAFVASAISQPASGTPLTSSYQVPNLPAGTYKLEFTPASTNTTDASQWYSGKTSSATATAITLTKSATADGTITSVNNVTLVAGAIISGTLSASSASQYQGVNLTAYDALGTWAGHAITDGSGAFSFTGLAAGTYTIDAEPGNGEPWWYGQSTQGAQIVVAVTTGQVSSGHLITLPADYTISGNVTGATATPSPIADVEVALWDATGNFQVGDTTTDSVGNYSLPSVPQGSYQIEFIPADGSGFIGQWLGGSATASGSTVVTINSSNVSNGVGGNDAALTQASASVSGTVDGAGAPNVPLDGFAVVAHDSTGASVGFGFTGADGGYTISGLAAGTYTLEFQASNDGYTAQWWNATTKATATPVTLTAGQVATGFNAVLAVANASISGTVVVAGSLAPITDGVITVFSADGTAAGYATTNSDGTYTVTGLPAGSYAVEFLTNDGSYLPAWWQGADSSALATSVPLTAGQAQAGIDATLAVGASISGTVYTAGSPNAVAPFSLVDVYDISGVDVDSAQTNAVGQYTVTGLAPGKYSIDFGSNSQAFAPQWLGGAASQATAVTITLLGNQQATGKNAVLASAASISGTVTNTSGQGLRNIWAQVWRLEGTTYVQEYSAETSGVGTYTVTGLPAGTYKVGFTDYAPSGNQKNSVYGDQYWKSQPTLASATALVLTAGKAVTAVNASLTKLSALAAFTTVPSPKITGTAHVGNVLTATSTAWAPATVVLTYQWERKSGSSAAVAITGATGTTYAPTGADVGDTIIVVVTGHRVGYSQSTSTSSLATAVVTA